MGRDPAPLSEAYNFVYPDRFAHVVAPLNPTAPQFVDPLQIVSMPDQNTSAATVLRLRCPFFEAAIGRRLGLCE